MMSGTDNDALYAQLDAAMQAALPRITFDILWPQLEMQCGSFVAYYGDTEVMEIDGYTVLSQLLDMSETDLLCTLTLNGDGSVAGLYFTFDEVPEPTVAPPAKVIEERVSIGENPWKLPGTLLIPESDKPVPAVVLVQGSGSTNRDEHIYAVRPFRDIANALSAQGIAVLRYDKRTYVYGAKITSSSSFRVFTVEEEVIQDAIAAGRLLAADSRIDPERVYILGHSLGAMLAPRIVSESGDLFHGMILACGTNKSFLEVLLRQARDADYLTAKQQTKLIEDGEAIYGMTEDETKKSKFNDLYAYFYWEMLQHPSAAELLNELERPTLIINGSRDIQVLESEGRDVWQQVLDMDAPWLTCYWTDVNHLLMRPEVSSAVWGTVGEYKVDCTVAEDITDQMAAFILNTEE
ncbi:MAG: alpha/beta fold hydrolase [Christensenellaceae bacterium]|nr:alpha/beta fold hydrolase [Christensenellaceae bacterium]